jgi:dipeptidyl aminopeptidase/acylaminoacyl peptidase
MDPIVPVVQAEAMIKVIEANGGQVKYVLFEKEGHGWRLDETVQRALEEELAFYHRVLGLGIDD